MKQGIKIYRHRLWIVCTGLAVIIFAGGCQNEKPASIPEILIESPYQGQTYQIPDSIHVKATVVDNGVITSVRVSLTDDNFMQVLPPRFFYPGISQFQMDFFYPVHDPYLAGGPYYLQVRADNGTNSKNEYQSVTLIEQPRVLEQIVVITYLSSSELEISSIQDNGTVNTIIQLNGDYAGSEISPRHKQLYLAGKESLNLTAINLAEAVIDWELQPLQPFPMHNPGCLYFDEVLLCSFRFEEVTGYNSVGSAVFNAKAQEPDAPSRIFRTGDYVLCDFQRKDNGIPSIRTLYYLTGNEKQRINTSFRVIEFHELEANTLLITANHETGGLILTYRLDQNLLYTEQAPATKILSSCQVGNQEFLVGTETGLLRYLAAQNSLSAPLVPDPVRAIAFDETSQVVYWLTGNEIHKTSYPAMVDQKTVSFSDPMLGFHLQFSK